MHVTVSMQSNWIPNMEKPQVPIFRRNKDWASPETHKEAFRGLQPRYSMDNFIRKRKMLFFTIVLPLVCSLK